MRILTAGESHGAANLAIIEGLPKGVKIEEALINQELKRRMSGFGRGKRMQIEADQVEILSGVRNKISLGSPVAVMVKNFDQRIFSQVNDQQAPLTVPRPAHADLAGCLKYKEKDLRNILERSSARETTAKVALGSVCKQFLANFDIEIASFTISCGPVVSAIKPKNVKDILQRSKNSQLNAIDSAKEKLMLKAIAQAAQQKNSLGGVVEIWAENVCAGLGSFMHYDQRLDARLALALMSIPAVKGVEVGLGFAYAAKTGLAAHDQIYYNKAKGYYHKTNNSGGIEGGISNGEPIVLKAAMKPIATLLKPLNSVDLINKKAAKAVVERSDTCAIAALGVIAESMIALVLTEAFLEKFGSDTLSEIKANYKNYLKTR